METTWSRFISLAKQAAVCHVTRHESAILATGLVELIRATVCIDQHCGVLCWPQIRLDHPSVIIQKLALIKKMNSQFSLWIRAFYRLQRTAETLSTQSTSVWAPVNLQVSSFLTYGCTWRRTRSPRRYWMVAKAEMCPYKRSKGI